MNTESLKARLLSQKDNWEKRLSIDLLLTRKCNCKCLHCLHRKKQGTMEYDTFDSIITEAEKIGINSINLNGGEIFLHPKISDILNRIADSPIRFSAVTNGTILGEDIIKLINFPLSISIDGPREFHNHFRGMDDAFEKAVNAIDNLKEEGISVSIISSIMKDNLKYLDWLVGFCILKKIKSLRVQPVLAYGKALDLVNDNKLLTQEEKNYLYSTLAKYSANLIGQLRIVSIGMFKSDISEHKCKIGLCFGGKCHKNSHPWPRSMTITPEGSLFPMSSYVSNKLCAGDITKGLKNAIDHYYASNMHINLLRFLEMTYNDEIKNNENEFLDMGLIFEHKLNNIKDTFFCEIQ